MRARWLRTVILVIGALALVVAGGALWVERPGPVPYEDELQLLRQLALSDDPDRMYSSALAEALDRSVVYVPAGSFLMGSDAGHDDERPPRVIYLDAFEIDRYEVTNAQYLRFVRATGHRQPQHWSNGLYPPGQPDYPVVGVNWADADAYCAWAGKRLPTEAEWEKACRGADARLYPWGNTWDPTRANVGLSGDQPWPAGIDDAWPLLQVTPASDGVGLRPVGSYPEGASPYGVMDLVGNVEEWVADWYQPNSYRDLPAYNPLSLGPEWAHSIRGSAWIYRSGYESRMADFSRCSARNSSHAYAHPRVGFRCARSVSGERP